jgi:hypothetical protein
MPTPLAIRSGKPMAWAIGVRMSGLPNCASTEPSSYSTIEWMMLWGWTTTSSRYLAYAEQERSLDQFEALVHHRRRIDRNLSAH